MGVVSIDFVIYQSSKKEKHDSISFKLPLYRADGTVESLRCFDKRLLHYANDDAIISYRNPVRDFMERKAKRGSSLKAYLLLIMSGCFPSCRWGRCKPFAFGCEAGNCAALRYWTLPEGWPRTARGRERYTQRGNGGAAGLILYLVRWYWELNCARRSVNCECLSW